MKLQEVEFECYKLLLVTGNFINPGDTFFTFDYKPRLLFCKKLNRLSKTIHSKEGNLYNALRCWKVISYTKKE